MRGSEWVLTVAFAYAAAAVHLFHAPAGARIAAPLLNLALVLGFLLLACAHALRGNRVLEIMRDWYPFPLLLLLYREVGWLAQPHVTFELELRWIEWDRAVLRGGLKAIIEAFGPVMPGLLEICYLLVYGTGMFGLGFLYAYGRRERAERLLFIFALAVAACYVQFPFWPSEPPRTVFPGEDAPAYDTIFRRLNWWILGGQSIHTSVFPSAHVAGAFAAAFGMWRALPERPWVWRGFLILATLIATATVYGRYHYVADAAAGFGMAVLALGAGRALQGETVEAPRDLSAV
jgi:membrane-associated phospholipid phosphatase